MGALDSAGGYRVSVSDRSRRAIKAVIWQNGTERGPKYNAVLTRVYKEADVNWQTTDSLGRDDLLQAAFALQRAYGWITSEEAQNGNGRSTS